MTTKVHVYNDDDWEDADPQEPFFQEMMADMQAFEKKFPYVDLVVESFSEDENGDVVKWRVIVNHEEKIFDDYQAVATYLSLF